MRSIFTLCVSALSLLFQPAAGAGGLIDVEWQTRWTSPAPRLEGPANDLLPAFRKALEVLPESAIVPVALSQPQLLGLPAESAQSLSPLILKRYEQIARDPIFRAARGHLPYCFSETRPTRGIARVFLPVSHAKETPVILFLHGTGGSFVWYHHFLAGVFPDSIIICPAFGIQPDSIPPEYLAECLAAVGNQIDHQIRKPSLLGLSAGGFGACRVFAAQPDRFDRCVVLGAYPPANTLNSFQKDSSIRFVAGSQEFFVTNGQLQEAVRKFRTRGVLAETQTIHGADHFFLLTHPKESAEILKEAVIAQD